MVSFLTGLYEIHLMMNFKIIYMPILPDDHFLSYCIMLCSLVSIVGAFFWGWLGDLRGVAFTILILSVLDFGSKLFSDFALTRVTIMIMVVLVGLISKSMTTLAGPGFVEYFGLTMGTELLPFKGISILLGYILVPLLQLATSDILTPHEYLIVISFASVVTLGCAIRLYTRVIEDEKSKLAPFLVSPEVPETPEVGS
jgi:MFS family permease